MATLEEMVNKISAYDGLFLKYGYGDMKDGTKPWSHRYTAADGTAIETRNSEWTFYDAANKVVGSGADPVSLEAFLNTR